MSKDEVEFIDKLRALSISAAYELLSGVDRLKLLSEELAGENRADAPHEDPKKKAKSLAYELARTELEHAEKLLKYSNSHADMLFDHAQRVMRSIRGGGQAPPAVVEIATEYGSSQSVTKSFTLRNPFAGEADVRFELEPFKDSSGKHEALLDGAVVLACVPAPVLGRSRAEVELTLTPQPRVAAGVYFSKVVVYLSAEIEKTAATRLLKLRVSNP